MGLAALGIRGAVPPGIHARRAPSSALHHAHLTRHPRPPGTTRTSPDGPARRDKTATHPAPPR
jgi:hypothetical protein